MAGRFSIETVFKAIDRVTAPVSRMQNRVGRFTRSMSRGLNDVTRAADRMGSGLRRAAGTVAVAGAFASLALGNIVRTGADFEQAITNVGAVTLQTRAEISDLEALAVSLGKTTKFTATQSANAMEIMARAGFENNEILAATPGILDAAAASGLEIAEVADHVSNVLKGMGLEAGQAGRVADVLALASARTNSSIGSLGESMRNVASTARQLNVPLENVVASVALLQDVGLDASVAGSAMNVMLTKMAVPSDKLQKLMRRLGISFKDSRGDMLPLSKVIQQLSQASDQLGGNFDKVAFLAELVGLRGQKAAANLVPLFESGKLETLVEELERAEGVSRKMAGIRMDTVLGSWTLLASAIDGVKVRIFSMNEGPLKETIDRWTAWVGENEALIATEVGAFLSDLVRNFQSLIAQAVKIAKLVALVWALVTALKAVSAVLAIVNALMLMNPIGLVIVGIAAVIAAISAVSIWLEELHAWFNELGIAAKIAFVAAGGPLAWLIAVGPKVLEAWEPIKYFFLEVFELLKDIVNLWAAISSFGMFGEFNNPFALDEDPDSENRPPRSVGLIGPRQADFSRFEGVIRTENGASIEITKGGLPSGLSIQQSGAF